MKKIREYITKFVLK